MTLSELFGKHSMPSITYMDGSRRTMFSPPSRIIAHQIDRDYVSMRWQHIQCCSVCGLRLKEIDRPYKRIDVEHNTTYLMCQSCSEDN